MKKILPLLGIIALLGAGCAPYRETNTPTNAATNTPPAETVMQNTNAEDSEEASFLNEMNTLDEQATNEANKLDREVINDSVKE